MHSSNPASETARICVVGHVDHGKSTLLGHLVLELGKVPEDQIQKVKKICQSKQSRFEPAFLFDALKEEQEQSVSIDTSRVVLELEDKRIELIDAPGHLEFLKNMTSGASDADVGILIVDCMQGVQAQTARHLLVLALLKVKSIVVALNKMDKVGFNKDTFDEIAPAVAELIEDAGLICSGIVPISALNGDNLLNVSPRVSWYCGLPLLAQTLNAIETVNYNGSSEQKKLRFVLQDVYKTDEDRLYAGRISAGTVACGDELIFCPSGRISRVKSILKYPHSIAKASAGMSVALTLEDPVFIERGETASHPDARPEIDNSFMANLIWLSQSPWSPERKYVLKIGSAQRVCRIQRQMEVEERGSRSQLSSMLPCGPEIVNGSFFSAQLFSETPVAFDIDDSELAQFVVCDQYDTVAAGMITGYAQSAKTRKLPANVRAETGYLAKDVYEDLHGHKGAVIWLTGLSGAGKSHLAKGLEHHFLQTGRLAVVLDGDNVRTGLCEDLGFSAEDRLENIRRLAQVAKILAERGMIAIVACISPYEFSRENARQIIGKESFFEVYVYCPVELCQKRDHKGLYSMSSKGTLKGLTGLDAPYQPPRDPAVRLDTSSMSLDSEIEAVENLLRKHAILPTAMLQNAKLMSAINQSVTSFANIGDSSG